MGILSGTIAPIQRYQLLLQAGFKGPDAITMTAISYFECGNCDMAATNKSGDTGLFQINAVHGFSASYLADPLNNAKAALSVFQNQGFRGWCTYPTGCNVTPGTQNQPTWGQFNDKLQWVVQQINAAAPLGTPSIGDIPGVGGGTTDQGSSTTGSGSSTSSTDTGTGATGGSGGGGTGTSGTSSTKTPGITNVGAIGPLPVNVPSGLVIGLIAVLLLGIGAIIFSNSVRAQVITNIVQPLEG